MSKKVLKRSCCFLLALLMALATMLLLFAGYSSVAFAAETTRYLNDPPLPAFNSYDYSLVRVDRYYDYGLQRYVNGYTLSDASRISLLVDKCRNVCALRGEVDRIRKNNDVANLQNYIHSDQIVPIWRHLTEADKAHILNNQLNAERAISYIRTTNQYKTTPDLKTYAEYYASAYLGAIRLRNIVTELDPTNAEFYKKCSVANLLTNADIILGFQVVRDIEAAVNVFRNYTTDVPTLENSFWAWELEAYARDLMTAASAYYPDYVKKLQEVVYIAE